jgi:hypothetical protein
VILSVDIRIGSKAALETVQKIIRTALGRYRFPSTRDGDRKIIWPQNTVTSDKTLYRGAGGREHSDIPLAELASLADILRSRGRRHSGMFFSLSLFGVRSPPLPPSPR